MANTQRNQLRIGVFVSAVVAFVFSQAVGYAIAQHREGSPAGYIELVPVRVTVGMPKDRTIALLSEHYDVSPLKASDVEDSWAVSEKTGRHAVTGTVGFVSGVLIRATRFWYLEDSAYSLAHTMSLLLDNLRDEGFTHCTISTRKAPTPSVETEELLISCGHKGIIVQADKVRGKEIQTVQVVENLQAEFIPPR